MWSSQYANELGKLATEMNTLQNKNTALENENEKLVKDNNYMKDQIQAHQKQIEQYHSAFSEISGDRQEMVAMKKKMAAMNKEITKLKEKIHHHRWYIRTLELKNNKYMLELQKAGKGLSCDAGPSKEPDAMKTENKALRYYKGVFERLNSDKGKMQSHDLGDVDSESDDEMKPEGMSSSNPPLTNRNLSGTGLSSSQDALTDRSSSVIYGSEKLLDKSRIRQGQQLTFCDTGREHETEQNNIQSNTSKGSRALWHRSQLLHQPSEGFDSTFNDAVDCDAYVPSPAEQPQRTRAVSQSPGSKNNSPLSLPDESDTTFKADHSLDLLQPGILEDNKCEGEQPLPLKFPEAYDGSLECKNSGDACLSKEETVNDLSKVQQGSDPCEEVMNGAFQKLDEFALCNKHGVNVPHSELLELNGEHSVHQNESCALVGESGTASGNQVTRENSFDAFQSQEVNRGQKMPSAQGDTSSSRRRRKSISSHAVQFEEENNLLQCPLLNKTEKFGQNDEIQNKMGFKGTVECNPPSSEPTPCSTLSPLNDVISNGNNAMVATAFTGELSSKTSTDKKLGKVEQQETQRSSTSYLNLRFRSVYEGEKTAVVSPPQNKPINSEPQQQRQDEIIPTGNSGARPEDVCSHPLSLSKLKIVTPARKRGRPKKNLQQLDDCVIPQETVPTSLADSKERNPSNLSGGAKLKSHRLSHIPPPGESSPARKKLRAATTSGEKLPAKCRKLLQSKKQSVKDGNLLRYREITATFTYIPQKMHSLINVDDFST